MSDNRITSTGAIKLFKYLSEKINIIHLNLNMNRLDDKYIEELGKYIQKHKHFETLDKP